MTHIFGYRSAGSSNNIDNNGYLWSASARNTNNAWAVKSNTTKGKLDNNNRNNLFPLRVLRTPFLTSHTDWFSF